MNIHLKQIVELSNYDKEIESFTPRIAEVYKKLNILIEDRDKKISQLEEFKEKIESLTLDAQKNRAHLEIQSQKLIEIASKSKNVKTDKELQAVRIEEDIAKEQLTLANNEIIRIEDLIEKLNVQKMELSTEIDEDNEVIKEFQTLADRERDELEIKRNTISQTRSELLSKMEQNMITAYEKVKLWAKDTAVVEVRKQACYGCYMKLNDKLYAEVIKANEIINCSHCGRIIYKALEE